MSDQSTDPGKRRLIKGALLGAGAAAVAPSEWATPVVRRMISPAHAQTVSAAAGFYEGTYVQLGTPKTISFTWPGGGGEKVLDVLDDGTSLQRTIALSEEPPVGDDTPGEYYLIELTAGTTPEPFDFYVFIEFV